MTRARRAVLIAYLLGVATLCIWVPWRVAPLGYPEQTLAVGYGFVWQGPRLAHAESESAKTRGRVTASVDLPRVLFPLAAFTCVACCAFLLAGRRC
jgi:hypothetical protein